MRNTPNGNPSRRSIKRDSVPTYGTEGLYRHRLDDHEHVNESESRTHTRGQKERKREMGAPLLKKGNARPVPYILFYSFLSSSSSLLLDSMKKKKNFTRKRSARTRGLESKKEKKKKRRSIQSHNSNLYPQWQKKKKKALSRFIPMNSNCRFVIIKKGPVNIK